MPATNDASIGDRIYRMLRKDYLANLTDLTKLYADHLRERGWTTPRYWLHLSGEAFQDPDVKLGDLPALLNYQFRALAAAARAAKAGLNGDGDDEAVRGGVRGGLEGRAEVGSSCASQLGEMTQYGQHIDSALEARPTSAVERIAARQ